MKMENEGIKEIKELLTEKMGCEVTISEVVKNNGNKRTAVLISRLDENIAPNIYIDDLLASINDQQITIDDAVDEIISRHDKGMKNIPRNIQMNKDFILKNTRIKVINYEANKEMLKKVVHRKFLDLAVTYRVCIEVTDKEITSYSVTNDVLDITGISIEELDRAVIHDEYIVKSMVGMYMITNKQCINGAAAILENDVLKNLADKLNSNLYILPADIHEIICLPADAYEVNEDVFDTLYSMVEDANEILDVEEILSNSVYKYDRIANEVTIIER